MIRTKEITTDSPLATGRWKTCSTRDSILSCPHQIEQCHSYGLQQIRSAPTPIKKTTFTWLPLVAPDCTQLHQIAVQPEFKFGNPWAGGLARGCSNQGFP